MGSSDVGMPLSRIAQFVVAPEPELLEETERIAVPRRDIEVGGDRVMIELGEETHEVVDHVAPRRPRPHHIDLRAIERHHLIRRKAPEIKHVRRVRLGHRLER